MIHSHIAFFEFVFNFDYILWHSETFRGMVEEQKQSFDKNDIRHIIDAFLVEMERKTVDEQSFNVSILTKKLGNCGLLIKNSIDNQPTASCQIPPVIFPPKDKTAEFCCRWLSEEK